MPELYGNFLLCDWKLLNRAPYHIPSPTDHRRERRHEALSTGRRASIGSNIAHDVCTIYCMLHSSPACTCTCTCTYPMYRYMYIYYMYILGVPNTCSSHQCTYMYTRPACSSLGSRPPSWTNMHTYMYMYIYAYIHVHVHVYTYMYMYVHVDLYCMCPCVYTVQYMYMYINIQCTCT